MTEEKLADSRNLTFSRPYISSNGRRVLSAISLRLRLRSRPSEVPDDGADRAVITDDGQQTAGTNVAVISGRFLRAISPLITCRDLHIGDAN